MARRDKLFLLMLLVALAIAHAGPSWLGDVIAGYAKSLM